jgi:hypothetical protein
MVVPKMAFANFAEKNRAIGMAATRRLAQM